MKNILLILILTLTTLSFSQDNLNAEAFLNNALKNYTEAKAIEIEVEVNLYERDSKSKEHSFTCVSKTKGNKSYLKIRNTDLVTTDSLRLFVDHNNKYMQLQEINNTQLKNNNTTDFVDTLNSNVKKFIANSKTEYTSEYISFTSKNKLENSTTTYIFSKKKELLEKIISSYNNSESSYAEIEMIYKTNVNETEGDIEINLKDFIVLQNKKFILNEKYTGYEFVNQFSNE